MKFRPSDWSDKTAGHSTFGQDGSLVDQALQALNGGRIEEAVICLNKTLAEKPANPGAMESLGAAFANRGLFREAELAFRRALEIVPGRYQTSMGLAGVRAALGDLPGASQALRRAVDKSSNDRAALLELGEAFIRLGLVSEALDVFEMALQIRAGDPEILFKTARALQILGRREEALERYQMVNRIKPGIGVAHANVATLQADLGQYKEARNELDVAIRLAPADQVNGLMFRRAGMSPVIFNSNDEIDKVRKTMRDEFDYLRITQARLRDPPSEVGSGNSNLAYHGRSNLLLAQLIARTYIRSCASLVWEAPGIRTRFRKNPDRLRLGVCSAFINDHTIAKVTVGLLEQLDRKRFEVILFGGELPSGQTGHALHKAADKAVTFDGDLAMARQTLAAADLDILMFTDFGAAPFTSFLAYARIAPVQVIGWGFPDTSGVPNADYYASTSLFEPPDAQAHYSEALIALPRLYSYLHPLEKNATVCTKRELGFEDADRLYICGQSLNKVHPDCDDPFARILRLDPKGRIILFTPPQNHWAELLKSRFAETISDVSNRIHFLPRLPPDKFEGALRAADALIDTMHFTGGYTTYLSFANHAPVVTWNGELMRG